MRINKIVKETFPFKGGCLFERQQILSLRIMRTDKIKRCVMDLPTEAEQDSYLTDLEARVMIK